MPKCYTHRPWQQGCSLTRIQPGSSTTISFQPPGAGMVVENMFVASSSQDLVIESIAIAGTLIAHGVSVASYLKHAPPTEELIQKVLSCFRYKDHTREEIVNAIKAASTLGIAGKVTWPLLYPGIGVQIVIQNPTEEEVRLQITLSGSLATLSAEDDAVD